MSKKRGLSLEEKRTKMLEIFYEKKDFFLLKELEKIAPKEKGDKALFEDLQFRLTPKLPILGILKWISSIGIMSC